MTPCRIFVVTIALPLMAALACSQNHAMETVMIETITVSQGEFMAMCPKARELVEAAKYELMVNPNIDKFNLHNECYTFGEVRSLGDEQNLVRRKHLVFGPAFGGWLDTEIVDADTMRCEFSVGNGELGFCISSEFDIDISPEPMRPIDTP